ncbi:hypothetical protein [Thermotomaculum hydrothermale]|nr:hypothetical protein [Thermotomaculum hydrothermale]
MMKRLLTIFSLFIVVAGMVACSGGAEGDPQVPSTFKIESVLSEGNTNNVEADMINSDDGLTADYVSVTVSNYLKNASATPSHFNDITIYKYSVHFYRNDGGTVFSDFERAVTETVQVNSTKTFSLELVRLDEKTHGALAGTYSPYEMNAEITLYGKNGSGQYVQAKGTIGITIANFGNDTASLTPSIDLLSADKTIISDGDDVTLFWLLSGSVAEIVIQPGDIHLNPVDYYPYGSYTLHNVTPPVTYTLIVSSPFGTASSEVSIDSAATSGGVIDPVINLFMVSPTTISAGQQAVISYDVSNADSLTLYPGAQTLTLPSGEITVSPTYTTDYVLLAKNNSGGMASATQTLTVNNVTEASITMFTGSRKEVEAGDVITLYWTIEGTYDKAEIFPWNAANDTDKIMEVTGMNSITTPPINNDTTFVLSVYSGNKVINATFEVTLAQNN